MQTQAKIQKVQNKSCNHVLMYATKISYTKEDLADAKEEIIKRYEYPLVKSRERFKLYKKNKEILGRGEGGAEIGFESEEGEGRETRTRKSCRE